jgi:hypothetical protein
MGLRRLRGRLDQVQGEANLTLDDIRALVEDLHDGFGLSVEVDAAKLMDMLNKLMTGVSVPDKFTIPLTLKVDPTIDNDDPGGQ